MSYEHQAPRFTEDEYPLNSRGFSVRFPGLTRAERKAKNQRRKAGFRSFVRALQKR